MSTDYTIETIDGAEHGHPDKRIRIEPDQYGGDSPLHIDQGTIDFHILRVRGDIPDGATEIPSDVMNYGGFAVEREDSDLCSYWSDPATPTEWETATLETFHVDTKLGDVVFPVTFNGEEITVHTWQDIAGDFGPDGVVIVKTAMIGRDPLESARVAAETYNQWARGEMYGRIIEKQCECCGSWTDEDSVWGYYSVDDAKADAIAEL